MIQRVVGVKSLKMSFPGVLLFHLDSLQGTSVSKFRVEWKVLRILLEAKYKERVGENHPKRCPLGHP